MVSDSNAPATTGHDDLFALARANRDVLTFSTLICAGDVGKLLSDDAGIDRVIRWCRDTGVTRIFLETYRGRVTADRAVLIGAKRRMEDAGLVVDGCVTTTGLGPKMKGKAEDPHGVCVCYLREETLADCRRVFEYTASIFDVIMIDDFLFTTCDCELCEQARGDWTWAEFRIDLMVDVSREHILAPIREVNPDATVIIKFPNWFDEYQLRGYDVPRQTELFDMIWVGNETREPEDARWRRIQQYRAFYIMRWLGDIGGDKTGGGWFDGIDTGPDAYVEQARGTVLGGAREIFLFNCRSMMEKWPELTERLRAEMPELFALARKLKGLPAGGIIAPKPPNSDPGDEDGIYDFPGILGLPIVPAATVPGDAKAVFLPTQALSDPDCIANLNKLIAAGTPILMTDGLASRLDDAVDLDAGCVKILEVAGDPYSLRNIPADTLARVRAHLLTPLGLELKAPRLVSLCLLGEEFIAVENFNDDAADVALTIAGVTDAAIELSIPRTCHSQLACTDGRIALSLPARSLALLRVERADP